VNHRLAIKIPKLMMAMIALAEIEVSLVASECRIRTAKRTAQPFALTVRTATAKNRRKEQRQRNTHDDADDDADDLERRDQQPLQNASSRWRLPCHSTKSSNDYSPATRGLQYKTTRGFSMNPERRPALSAAI